MHKHAQGTHVEGHSGIIPLIPPCFPFPKFLSFLYHSVLIAETLGNKVPSAENEARRTHRSRKNPQTLQHKASGTQSASAL